MHITHSDRLEQSEYFGFSFRKVTLTLQYKPITLAPVSWEREMHLLCLGSNKLVSEDLRQDNVPEKIFSGI